MTTLRATPAPAPVTRPLSRPASRWRAYLDLTKARLSSLVLLTTAVGFVHGADAAGGIDLVALLGTLVGTALAALSANALNQVIEVPRDRLMQRTRTRPLPAGTFTPRHASIVAAALGAAGIGVLTVFANGLAAALGLLTLLLYVLLYTPLKVRTTLNTLVGAVCGALPPMIGWAGADGRLGAGAWVLAALLFVWQLPHFLALAWLHRDDYARGRFRMLPVLDRSGRITGRIVVLTSLMLMPLALTATLVGLTGWVYAAGSLALGLWLLDRAVRLYAERTRASARRVFLASLVYLSGLLVLLLVDRGPLDGPAAVPRYAGAGDEVTPRRTDDAPPPIGSTA